jgi:hypothetical protein
MVRYQTQWAIIVTALALAFIATHSSPATAQADPAGELIANAGKTMIDLQSFRFVLTTPVGKTFLAREVELDRIEGSVVRPASFHAEFTVKLAFITLTLDATGIGSRIWVQDPLSGTYIEIGSEVTENLPPLDFLNPDWLLAQALDLIEEAVIAGQEEIDGIAVTRVDGVLNLGEISSIATPIPTGVLTATGSVPITLWVDGDSRLIRAEFNGPLLASEEGSGRIVRRIDLSAFNEPITIDPPEST